MIFITGDTHGDVNYHKLNSKNFPQGKEGGYVIIAGDAGVIFDGAGQDRYVQKFYNEKAFTTLFIDGNHENFDILNSYPVEMWNGGKVHKISDKIIHLMRGQVFTIEGKTFFTMGGARSVDKALRREHESWWPQEMITEDEMSEACANLDAVNNQVDYIISHSAPTQIMWRINPSYEYDTCTNFLQMINETVKFKHHYFGHYHIDEVLGYRHTAVQENVILLE